MFGRFSFLKNLFAFLYAAGGAMGSFGFKRFGNIHSDICFRFLNLSAVILGRRIFLLGSPSYITPPFSMDMLVFILMTPSFSSKSLHLSPHISPRLKPVVNSR